MGARRGRKRTIPARMVATRPKAATTSETIAPRRPASFWETCDHGSANIRWAISVPATPPTICARRTAALRVPAVASGPLSRDHGETTGLKCAPEIGPKIEDQNDRDVAGRHRVPEECEPTSAWSASSAMMPEPTTGATSIAVPSSLAARRRGRSKVVIRLALVGPFRSSASQPSDLGQSGASSVAEVDGIQHAG